MSFTARHDSGLVTKTSDMKVSYKEERWRKGQQIAETKRRFLRRTRAHPIRSIGTESRISTSVGDCN